MKRMSQISKELRDRGCKFSQTTFSKDLLDYAPVFKEGKVVFYPDNITDDMFHLYKQRKPKVKVTAVVQDEVDERQATRLERMEHMLENISGYLALTVPA